MRRPSATQIVVALTILGGVLRFATLNVQSIWGDEAATILLVHRSFSGMLSHLSTSESTPPLYYVLVWCWTKIFGIGPIGFRSFSALAGTAAIPLMYGVGRQVSPRTGLWAAALTAVSPAMYYYSQEARAYVLLVTFSAAAFLLWQRALREPSARRLALWSGMSALALLTHYFAALLFAGEALILARRVGWRRTWAPIGAVVVVGLALAPLAASQRSGGKVKWIEEASLPSRVGETAKLFLVGVYGPLEIFSAALSGLLVLGAVALLLRRGRGPEREAGRDGAIVLVIAFALPLLAAASHAVDVYDGRNVLANWIPFALLVCVGLGAARARWAANVLGGGLCAISLAVIVAINLLPAYQRDDWRGIARSLGPITTAPVPTGVSTARASPAQRSPRVIVSERYGSAPLSIYVPHLHVTSAPSVSTSEVAFVALRTRHTRGAPSPAVVPSQGPPGFHLAGVTREKAFAVARFSAPRPTRVSTAALRRISGLEESEAIVQR